MFLRILFLLLCNLKLMAAEEAVLVTTSETVEKTGITIGDISQFYKEQSQSLNGPRSYLPYEVLCLVTVGCSVLISDANKQFCNQCPSDIFDFMNLNYSSFDSPGASCIGRLMEAALGVSVLFSSWAYGSNLEKKLFYFSHQKFIGWGRSLNTQATVADLKRVIDKFIECRSPLLKKLSRDQLYGLMKTQKYFYQLIELFKDRNLQNPAMNKIFELGEMTIEQLETELLNPDMVKACDKEANFGDILWFYLEEKNKTSDFINCEIDALQGYISYEELKILMTLNAMTVEQLENELSKNGIFDKVADLNRFYKSLTKILPREKRSKVIIDKLKELKKLSKK